MSKQDEQVKEQQVITDPFKFVYTPGTKVIIDGGFFASVLQYLGASAQEEIKEMVIVNQFPLATGPQRDETGMVKMPEEQVILTISPKGKRAEILFQEGMSIHMEQIENGIAVDVNTVPTQSPLDLGK